MRRKSAMLAALLVATAVTAKAQNQAVVSRHLIYPGQIVEAHSLVTVDATHCPNCDPGFLTDAATIVGKIAARTLSAGKLIFPDDLRNPPSIMRGKEVTVFYRNGSIQISMTGIPMADATVGETVQVRNPKSGVIITGLAGQDGTVTVAQ